MASEAVTEALSPRALRFAARLRGERQPSFAELVRQKEADRSAAEPGGRVAVVLGLLQARPALDREVSGARLQAYAELVGDDLLDAVRDADLEDVAAEILRAHLPPPAMVERLGDRLLAEVGRDERVATLARIAIAVARGAQVPA